MELASGFLLCDTFSCKANSSHVTIKRRVTVMKPPYDLDLCEECYASLGEKERRLNEGEGVFSPGLDVKSVLDSLTYDYLRKSRTLSTSVSKEDSVPDWIRFKVPAPKTAKSTNKASVKKESPSTVDQVDKESDNGQGIEGIFTSGDW